jgi:hypothetical protein
MNNYLTGTALLNQPSQGIDIIKDFVSGTEKYNLKFTTYLL